MANVVGLRELEAALTRVGRQVEAASRGLATDGAHLVEAAAKRNFEGSHKRGEPHVGGDKPNVVTGTLRRSIRSLPPERAGVGEWVVRVGPTVVYGRRVELGYAGGPGRGHAHTRPFPYFTPAVRSTATAVFEIARARWAAASRA